MSAHSIASKALLQGAGGHTINRVAASRFGRRAGRGGGYARKDRSSEREGFSGPPFFFAGWIGDVAADRARSLVRFPDRDRVTSLSTRRGCCRSAVWWHAASARSGSSGWRRAFARRPSAITVRWTPPTGSWIRRRRRLLQDKALRHPVIQIEHGVPLVRSKAQRVRQRAIK